MVKKNTLILFVSFFSFVQLFAQESKIDSLINKLSTKIAVSQYNFNSQIYPEIAFIRNEYNVPNLLKNDTPFIKKLSDPIYKMSYPTFKFYNKDFVITEDCITENLKTLDAYKLFYYSLYNNIKLPNDFFDRLETTTKEDDLFLSSYYALNTIFYLKKYHPNLTEKQKAQLNPLEQKISTYLYTNFVDGKPWSFRRILSVKALKINNNILVNNIDLSELIDLALKYGKPNTNILDMGAFTEDTKDFFLMNNIGIDKLKQLQAVSLLWIILIEKK